MEVRPPYRYNDQLRYYCQTGYTLVTDGNQFCGRRFSWTGTSVCEPPPIKCGQAGRVPVSFFGRLSNHLPFDGQWPWHAVITRKEGPVSESYSDGNLVGGGSLINNKWVLTAYSIFSPYEPNGTNLQQQFRITLGMYGRYLRSMNTAVFDVHRIIKHPSYTENLEYDIALVELGQMVGLNRNRTQWLPVPHNFGWVNYTSFIKPVCLPCLQDNCLSEYIRQTGGMFGNLTEQEICDIEKIVLLTKSPNQNRAVVTGFGRRIYEHMNVRTASTYRYLWEKYVKLNPDNVCREFIQRWNTQGMGPKVHTNTTICTTNVNFYNRIPICDGDSGGPLVRELYNENTNSSCWVQIGIVSWIYGCGQIDIIRGVAKPRPDMFTNLLLLMPWVKQHITEA